MKTELFIIDPGIYMAVAPEEITATVTALKEIDLYHLPYDKVTVRLMDFAIKPMVVDITVSEQEAECPQIIIYNPLTELYKDVSGKPTEASEFFNDAGRPRILFGFSTRTFEQLREHVCNFLITLLSTRNAVKTTTVNKLAQLGIGKRKYKNRYTYVTTISLPHPETMEDDKEHAPTGVHKAAHLRRGHIRHQHYGPKSAFVKRVWIAPVFVNADPNFVSQRQRYNVTRPAVLA